MGGGGGGYFSGPSSRPPKPDDSSDTKSADGAPQATPSTGAPSGGRGAGGTPVDPCAIRDEGVLRSPIPSVVAGLHEGQDLLVRVRDIDGVKVVVAHAPDGSPAGVIDCEREQELIDCIEQGNGYVARVGSVRGGTVAVGIRRISTP